MKKSQKISRIIYNSAAMLMLTISMILLLNSLMFMAGISIKAVFLPLSALAAGCLYFYLIRGGDIHEAIYGVILAAFVALLFTAISGSIYDLSYDGNWYHKAALGSLKHGWNPLYDSLGDFAAVPGGVCIGNLAESALWADHYCKASWIVGANIHAVTGNIECAKAINPAMVYVLFAVMYRYLTVKGFSLAASVAVPILTALNPVTLPQLFTFYTDGLLACSLFTVIVLLFGFADREYGEDIATRAALLFCTLVLCINIKFTGLAYTGIFCLAFFVLYAIYAVRDKRRASEFAKPILFFILTVAVAVLVVGSSSYAKNLLEHGNPLYPLFGKDSADIMTRNQPTVFAEMDGTERLYNALFSQTSNLIGDGEILLKKPFEMIPYETFVCGIAPDIRLGGMGPLFSGILILSIPVLIIAAIYLAIKNKYALFSGLCVILPAIMLLFLIEESWWARYSPYLWLFPMLALLFLIYILPKVSVYVRLPAALAAVIMAAVCTVNTLFFARYIRNCRVQTEDIKEQLTYLAYVSKNDNVTIIFPNYAFYGVEYNFKDYGINYTVTAELPADTRHIEIYGGKAVAAITPYA